MVVQFPSPWKTEESRNPSVGVLMERGGKIQIQVHPHTRIRSRSGTILMWSPSPDGSGIRCFQKGNPEEAFIRLGTAVTWNEWNLAPVPVHQDPSGTWLYGRPNYLCSAPSMLTCLLRAMQFASSPAPVHIFGESGTGKEGLAALIHSSSSCGSGPFIAINCGALHANLGHGELFGRERGSYTGATHSAPGLLEQADGGTLFLDEIGELSPDDQSRLLRVLETGTLRRIGGSQERRIRVRILSATHTNLEEAVARGTFRADLYFRLCVFQLTLPPLRERPEDLTHLIPHFLQQFGHSGVCSREATEILKDHCWSGNIRELRNVLMQAALLAGCHPVGTQHIHLRNGIQRFDSLQESEHLRDQRDKRIRDELLRNGGNRKATCRSLAISRSTLYRWIKNHPDWHRTHSVPGLQAPWASVDTPMDSGDDGTAFSSGGMSRGAVALQPVPS